MFRGCGKENDSGMMKSEGGQVRRSFAPGQQMHMEIVQYPVDISRLDVLRMAFEPNPLVLHAVRVGSLDMSHVSDPDFLCASCCLPIQTILACYAACRLQVVQRWGRGKGIGG